MLSNKIFYIIDDDNDDQELLIEAFSEIDASIKCFTAGNGEEGIEKLQSGKFPKPYLIFVDMHMPRINGKQFLRFIKKDLLFKDIHIIIYSTLYDEIEAKHLKEIGAAHYLKKPVNFVDLKKSLKLILSNLYKKEDVEG